MLYTESKGISRVDMPQIDFEHLPEFKKFLKDKGVLFKIESVPISSLKPTQKEFNPTKVKVKLKQIKDKSCDKVMLSSSDNYIMDGHHYYSAMLELQKETGKEQMVSILVIDKDIDSLLKLAFKFDKTYTKNINETKTFKDSLGSL